LQDAKAQGADMYLLLGDYIGPPYENVVADELRKIKPATVISGNGEGYFVDFLGRNPQEFTDEQFKPLYWSYHSLSRENLEYMTTLPETAVISDGDIKIHMAHAMGLFYRSQKIDFFHPGLVRALRTAAPFSHEEYRVRAREALLACPEAVAEIHAMPKGIYLFGHNHLQFHMEYKGWVFINPGSCGGPLDLDTRAPYTLLTIDGAEIAVAERRVEYDLNTMVEELDNSGFTAHAPVWSEVMKLGLTTGKDYFSSFVAHLIETSQDMGETGMPVSNQAWDTAVKTWVML